jgi:hypothetical protein
MYLGSNGSHDTRIINSPAEWNPQPVNFSSQRLPDGARVESYINTPAIVEVNDGFYETGPGKLWLEFAAAIHTQFFTLSVLPTGGTNLLLPFHNKTAYMVAGEDITPEEYKNGDYFCLISEKFAEQCAVSLLSGFLLIAALSVAIGCAAGIIAEGRITDSLTRQEYYDTSYTIGPPGDEGAELDGNAKIAPFAPAAGLLLFFVTCGVSAVFTYRNVREEPLKLLGKAMDA